MSKAIGSASDIIDKALDVVKGSVLRGLGNDKPCSYNSPKYELKLCSRSKHEWWWWRWTKEYGKVINHVYRKKKYTDHDVFNIGEIYVSAQPDMNEFMGP